MLNRLLDYLSVFNLVVVIAGDPDFGDIFLANVDVSRKQRLQRNRGILIKVKPHFIEIKEAFARRQIFGPVVFDPFQHHEFAGLKIFDFVRTAAEHRLQTWFGKVLSFPVGFGQYADLRQNQRQFAVVGAFAEIKTYMPVVYFFRSFDVGIIHFVQRLAFFNQTVETEDDVVGGNRRSVMKTRFRVNDKADKGFVLRQFKFFGQQRIGGRRVVRRRHRQCIQRQSDGSCRRNAFENKRIEAVKAAVVRHNNPPAFRRIGINIGKVFETRFVFGFTVQGNMVI